jgi:hypothetical protein
MHASNGRSNRMHLRRRTVLATGAMAIAFAVAPSAHAQTAQTAQTSPTTQTTPMDPASTSTPTSSSPPPSDIVASNAAPFDETRRLADEHIRIGVQDFNARLFREALHEFEIAYQISHDPLLLSNIGTARFETGDLAGARDALDEYLRRVPDPPNRDAIQARLDEANRRIAAAAPITPASSAPPNANRIREQQSVSGGLGTVRATGLVIGGVGVITLGLGIGFWTGVDSAYQVCARTPCDAGTQPRTLDTVSVAMIWGGAGLAAGGLLLFLVGPRPESAEHAHRSRVRVTQVAFDPVHGLAVGGEF